jgi:tripartite-type tricarboxylate transporter receptor subunit TctC
MRSTPLRARARIIFAGLTFASLALPTGLAQAQGVSDFYRGRTMTMVIATSPGGDYDQRGRLVSRHMNRHIPGEPNIAPQNMPGGVGLAAANWLASVAPRDGSVLHMIMQNMPAHQAIGGSGARFDVRKFGFVGNTTNSPNLITAWHTTGVRTIKDAMERELVVGASGTATASSYYPSALNALIGTKFRIVNGYPGGNDVNLAMEKGEVGGRGSNSLASWRSGHPHWIAQGKIHFLAQIALERHPDLADVPLIWELAKSDEDREVLRFICADVAIARALVTTPETPPARLEALRRAFDATMKDPDFLAEAGKMKMDISPTRGEEAQKVAEAIVAASPAVLARAKVILEGTGK